MAGRQRGNGSGSITKVTDSKGRIKYRVRVTVSTYFDEDAIKTKSIMKSLGTYKTKAEAEKILSNYNDSPYDLESKVKTVGDLYEVWSADYFEKLR